MTETEQRRPESRSDAPPARAPARYSARDVAALFVGLIGTGVLATAALLNPWVARIHYGPRIVDHADALAGYALTSLAGGLLILFLAHRIGRDDAGRGDGLALLSIVVVFILLADRLLLVRFGQPLWIHDPVLHYRHRPGAVRTLDRAGRPDDLIRINSLGQHDTELPIVKPASEWRMLLIGDSVTMGDQVTYAETFAAQLEERLRRGEPAFPEYQVVNTGVHGYASFQELEMLRESLALDPDLIVVGFCLNDLTEPSVVERGFDGADLDYHGVAASASPLQGWFLNETGFGRLVEEIRARGTTRGAEQRAELDNVRSVSTSPADDPRWAPAWHWVERDLGEMAELAREADVPLVLLIFPFTFQLFDAEARGPQQTLAEEARRLGIDVIDLMGDFERRVFGDGRELAVLRAAGISNDRLERVFEPELRTYFLDADHLTPAGHAVVADALYEYLRTHGRIVRRPERS